MIRVGVLGAGGRMGQEVCRAVAADPGLELVAAVDPRLAGIDLRQVAGVDGAGVLVANGVDALERSGAEVAVDFTVADAAVEHMRWCAEHAVHAVVGTTGIDDGVLQELSSIFERSPANCVIAANFAIGAVLMMRLAELAAPFMDAVEVVEAHHGGKIDAPSGTALRTAERLATARSAGGGTWPADHTTTMALPGARGAEGAGMVRIHSLRLPGVVSQQEVVFGSVGQTLTIRHDAYDRSCYMPGMLLAVRSVPDRPGLTVGLDALLGF